MSKETFIRTMEKALEQDSRIVWYLDTNGVNINGIGEEMQYYPESESIQLFSGSDCDITIDLDKITKFDSYTEDDTLSYDCFYSNGIQLTVTFLGLAEGAARA